MPWLPKRTVVVPVDFSEDAFTAVDTALELVAGPANVHVVYVLPIFDPAEPDVVWSTINDETRRQHAEQALHERLNEAKYQGLNFHVQFGEPGHKITELASQLSAELMVLSSHGRTGLSRLLLGSVAEKVIRLAHCPVLVLRK